MWSWGEQADHHLQKNTVPWKTTTRVASVQSKNVRKINQTSKLTVTVVKHHRYQVHQNDSTYDMLRQTAWTRWPHVRRLSFVTTCVFMKTFASYVVRHVKVKNCTFTTRHYYLSSSSSTYYTSNQFNLELQLIKKLLSPLCCYLK